MPWAGMHRDAVGGGPRNRNFQEVWDRTIGIMRVGVHRPDQEVLEFQSSS